MVLNIYYHKYYYWLDDILCKVLVGKGFNKWYMET